GDAVRLGRAADLLQGPGLHVHPCHDSGAEIGAEVDVAVGAGAHGVHRRRCTAQPDLEDVTGTCGQLVAPDAAVGPDADQRRPRCALEPLVEEGELGGPAQLVRDAAAGPVDRDLGAAVQLDATDRVAV